jgi:hypothetical protein
LTPARIVAGWYGEGGETVDECGGAAPGISLVRGIGRGIGRGDGV